MQRKEVHLNTKKDMCLCASCLTQSAVPPVCLLIQRLARPDGSDTCQLVLILQPLRAAQPRVLCLP